MNIAGSELLAGERQTGQDVRSNNGASVARQRRGMDRNICAGSNFALFCRRVPASTIAPPRSSDRACRARRRLGYSLLATQLWVMPARAVTP
jgi:hypothetical protein